VTTRSLVNPVDSRHELSVVEPTGSGSPWTGGTCGGAGHPVVLVAHGYSASAVGAYQGMVDHLVSNGFVVVFPGYSNDYDPLRQYAVVDAGLVAAVDSLGPRVDVSRLGVIGHSFGAGMSPWLLQQASGRGWGSQALWGVAFAPWFSFGVGQGAIALPSHARFTTVAYDRDSVVDARIGIEVLGSLTIPETQREHVMLRSDTSAAPFIFADHYGPVSLETPAGALSTDHLDRWAAFPILDSTSRCSIEGVWCDTDLSYTGTRADGSPVVPALVSDAPADLGPRASQECTSALNPRGCP
jgi:hypothetical protein